MADRRCVGCHFRDGRNSIRVRSKLSRPCCVLDESTTGLVRGGRLFEQEFASYTGTKHALAVANGTAALELSLYALGVGPGDEVIIPSRTFIATASCVAMRGAVPVAADVDRDSQTLTAETVREAITSRTKAIIAVHLAGWPCDMDPIVKLADEAWSGVSRRLRPSPRSSIQGPACGVNRTH